MVSVGEKLLASCVAALSLATFRLLRLAVEALNLQASAAQSRRPRPSARFNPLFRMIALLLIEWSDGNVLTGPEGPTVLARRTRRVTSLTVVRLPATASAVRRRPRRRRGGASCRQAP